MKRTSLAALLLLTVLASRAGLPATSSNGPTRRTECSGRSPTQAARRATRSSSSSTSAGATASGCSALSHTARRSTTSRRFAAPRPGRLTLTGTTSGPSAAPPTTTSATARSRALRGICPSARGVTSSGASDRGLQRLQPSQLRVARQLRRRRRVGRDDRPHGALAAADPVRRAAPVLACGPPRGRSCLPCSLRRWPMRRRCSPPVACRCRGPVTDGPYAPQPILPGGIVITLYTPGSPSLNASRVREAEQYNMTNGVPGRIQSIVNIHNPSIEVHTVDPGTNTGPRSSSSPAADTARSTSARSVGTSSRISTTTASTPSSCAIGCATTATSPKSTPSATQCRRSVSRGRVPRSGASTRRRSASWVSPPAPSSPQRPVSSSPISMGNTTPPTIRSAECPRGRTSWRSCIPVRRRSRAARARRFLATLRRRSSRPPVRVTGHPRPGPMSTLPPC
jgi:hypothetical protein